jgi:hypothetical protein
VKVWVPAAVQLRECFRFIWCFCQTICSGIVKYDATLHIVMPFKIKWDQSGKRLIIKVLSISVNAIQGPRVTGCHAPWLVRIFYPHWQDTITKGLQSYIEFAAAHFAHSFNVPRSFSPYDGIYVDYQVTNLLWFEDSYIVCHAKAKLTAP